MNTRHLLGGIASTILITSVVAANWATSKYGFIPVGFGYTATAGTLVAGVALAARDAIQDLIGKMWMLATLAVAALVSFVVADPHIATASAVAFVCAELLDFAVYTPIRNRSRLGDWRWATAVVASSIVGILADTIVFLWIAFGAAAIAPALAGQLIGKAWATFGYLILGKAVAVGAVLRQSNQQPAGA